LRAITGWAQLAFGQVVGGINAIVIQKGKEMVAPVDITANEMAAAIKFSGRSRMT
jgi:hypothetical protein